MDGSALTRHRYPAIIPHDLETAEPVTVHKPRTTLSFAETAALENAAMQKINGHHRPKHNSGKTASPDQVNGWLQTIAALPSPFIALDAERAMGIAKSSAHYRLEMMAEKGLVQKARTRTGPQLWEVVKKIIPA